MSAEPAAAMTDGGKRIALLAISDRGLNQVVVGDFQPIPPIEESENGVGMARRSAVADGKTDSELIGRLALRWWRRRRPK